MTGLALQIPGDWAGRGGHEEKAWGSGGFRASGGMLRGGGVGGGVTLYPQREAAGLGLPSQIFLPVQLLWRSIS